MPQLPDVTEDAYLSGRAIALVNELSRAPSKEWRKIAMRHINKAYEDGFVDAATASGSD